MPRNELSRAVRFLSGLLNSRQSLFTYHEDEKYEDFVDMTYVPMFFDQLDSLFSDKTLEIQAKAACGEVKECLFDIAASGSLRFGNSTKQSVEHYNERKKDINTGTCQKFFFSLLVYFPRPKLALLMLLCYETRVIRLSLIYNV